MGTLAFLTSLLGASVVSGLVPLVNAEALVVGAAIAAPPGLATAVAFTGALGQMIAKLVLYGGGRGAGAVAHKKAEGRARAMANRLESRPLALGGFYFASASVGLPPLYLMSIVAGLARMSLWTFLILGMTGRFLRFWLLALIPGWF